MRSINRVQRKLQDVNYLVVLSALILITTLLLTKASLAEAVNAPSGLTSVAVSSSQINLSWTNNSTDSVSFEIWRMGAKDSSYTWIGTTKVPIYSYTNSGLLQGLYYYKIRASYTPYSGAPTYYSSYSNETYMRTLTLNAPSNLTPRVTSPTEITLDWADNTTYETAYYISRSTSQAGPYSTIGSVGPNITTYKDNTAATGITYYYFVSAFDGKNYSGSNIVNVKILTISASAGNGGTISPSGLVGVNAGATQAFTIIPTPNAGYVIEYVTVDTGSIGAVNAYTFNNITTNHTIAANFAVDTIPPTGSVAINNGATTTKSQTVTLMLTASDNAGTVTAMKLSSDNSVWSSEESYATTKSWTLTSGEGTKTVYVKFKDVAGNWSPAFADAIILDTTAPVIAITSPLAGPTNSDTPLLTYTFSDGTVTVYVDNVIVTKVSGSSLNALFDGAHTVRVESVDAAGNKGTAQVTFSVDIAPPTGTITINNGETYTKATAVTLALGANDTVSGVSQMQFSGDNVTWTTPESYAPAKSWTLSLGDENKTVWVKLGDMAGNWSSAIADSIVLDTEPPTGSLLINAGASVTNSTSVMLALGANDTVSDVSQMQFSGDNVTWTTPEPYAPAKSWTLSGDGNKSVWVKYSDMADNWSPAIADSILLDTMPSLVTISSPTTGIISTNTPTLTFAVTKKSGISKIGVKRSDAWYLDMNGNGVWEAASDVIRNSGSSGQIPIAGDWNGDGTTEIGVFGDGTWYLDMNHVNMASYVYVTPQNPGDPVWNTVGAADFNADGKPDILWRNTTTGENVVWYMDGTTLTGVVFIDSVPDLNWQMVGTGDFNSDGKADILWRHMATGDNAVWYMNGAAKTGYAFLETIADLNWKIVGTGDFNTDGKADILWRHMATGDNAVWYMDGVTKAAYAFLNPEPDLNQQIVGVGDFNNDGQADILFQHKVSGDLVVWFMNGIVRTSYAYFNPNNPGSPDWKARAVQDFNGDSKPDILFRNAVSGDLVVWHMIGSVVNMNSNVYVNPQNAGDLAWQAVGGADFNSDGKPDILWRNTTTGLNSVWFMDGTILTGSAVLDSVPDLGWQIVGGADFNSDGKPDILWRNTTTGLNAVWFMDGAIHTGSDFSTSVPDLNWNIVGVGDFNNDVKSDILWRNTSTGENYVWYMDGVTQTDGVALDSVSDLDQQIVGVGDFNSDGQIDILFQHKVSGDLIAWFMNGIVRTGYACLKPNNPGSPGWKARAVQDFNGDGKPDILFQNVTSGDLVVRHMIGVGDSGIFDYGDASYTFGTSGDLPVTGDWNGDGKTEIGVVRGGGTWFLDMNGNGAWETGIDAIYSFGAPGDKPITGDWNGDGRTKIGVVRGNIWFLDMNGNGTSEAGEPIYYFGDTLDVPITGDWDGSGTTKIGVFRNGTWYLDSNGNGAWQAGIDDMHSFGGPGDIPVVGDWSGPGTETITTTVDGVVVNKLSGNNLDTLSDGPHTVRVEATDAAGNTGSASVFFIVDTTAPIVSSFLINNGAAYTNTATVTLMTAITDTNGVDQMQFSNDNGSWSNLEAYAPSKSWVLDSTVGDGTKTVYAKFKDKAGNFSSVSAASIVFDTVAPTVSIISPEAEVTSDVAPLLKYTISDGTVVVKVDGQIVSKMSGDSLDNLEEGAHTVKVEATDSAGNKGEDSKIITIEGILTIDPIQTPTNISSQTITGTRESGSLISISLNTSAVAGTVVYPSSNTWSCPITGLTAGTNTITVTGNQQTISTSIVYNIQAIMTNVEISRNSINTANEESSTVFLTLASAATVTLKVIPETSGPGGTPIYQKTEAWSSGPHAFEWYGKNNSGAIVSDEAYVVVIDASNGTNTTTYNPPVPAGSGYISCPDPGSDYDPYRSAPLKINYYLSQPARVTLAMQTSSQHSFSLLNKVPLYTGNYTYEWDGRDDQDNMITSGATVTCPATLLAENVIITTGNTPRISQLTVDPYTITLSYGEFSKIRFDVESSASPFVTVMLKPPTGSEIALLGRWLPAGNNTVELNWPDYEAIPAPGSQFPVYLQGVYTLTIQAIAAGKSDVKKGVLQVAY